MAGDDRPDLCVIGGGAGGHAVALAAAAIGARCMLIDPADRLGRGQAADLAESTFLRETLDRQPGEPFDWIGFRRRLGLILAADHANHAAARLSAAGVNVVRGTARFTDARTVTANGLAIRARRFVLATGASAQQPGWAAGLSRQRLLRPAELLSSDALPSVLGIISAVPGGLAWAQALARLGSAVTLVAEPGALGRFDPELIRPVLDALRREGVEVMLRNEPCESCPFADAAAVMIIRPSVPETASLGLPEAGITCQHGVPTVDRRLRTTNPRVYAIGDVLGAASPGAVAQQVGLVLRTALFRLPAWSVLAPVPETLRTDPPIAQVGQFASGPSAEGRHILRLPLGEAMPGTPGLVKIVASRAGRVVGAGVVGPGAVEGIVPWAFAMARRIPVSAMAELPAPPATVAEAGRRAAIGFLTGRLRGPWVKRLISALRRLP